MRDADMARLLTIAAAVDHRDLSGVAGKAAVAAWMQAIGDLGYDECVEALGVHRRSSTEYLVPAHIAEIVHEVVRPEQAWIAEQVERFESGLALVEGMGGTRAQWEAATSQGLGAEQTLLERLEQRARARAVEA